MIKNGKNNCRQRENIVDISHPDFSGSQVPVDKKLDPAWVRSLRERGTPTTYLKSKAELRYIGMPVGGICAGTMYLGGDGRLWLWDIFNRNQLGIDARVIEWKGRKLRPNDGSTYVDPASGIRPIRQGFVSMNNTPFTAACFSWAKSLMMASAPKKYRAFNINGYKCM